jgi:predicted amidohydrolase YtcJ
VCSSDLKAYHILDITNPEYKNFRLGILNEKNQDMFRKFIAPQNIEEIKEYLLKMNPVFAQNGITSVISDDFSAFASIDYKDILTAYIELYKEDALTYKVCQKCALPSMELINDFLDNGYNTKQNYGNYRIGPLKLYLDGSLGARTALINGGYADAKVDGISNHTQDALMNMAKLADTNGMQLAIHGIGDNAIERILDVYEVLDESNGINSLRHGIVHAQITTPDLIDRIIKNNALIYAQPIFVASDQDIVESRVGLEKAKTSYPYKTLLDNGVEVAFSTDAPVEPINPWPNIYCAVTRKDPYDTSKPAYYPNQAVDIYETIKAYTLTGAYCSFEEHKKGTLEKGKVADFSILDPDIFTIDSEQVLDTKVLHTVMDGKLVFSAEL